MFLSAVCSQVLLSLSRVPAVSGANASGHGLLLTHRKHSTSDGLALWCAALGKGDARGRETEAPGEPLDYLTAVHSLYL